MYDPSVYVALLVLLTLLVYAGTWGHGFVNYDDDVTIINLTLIRELSLERMPAFFRPDIHRGLPEYMPLKNLSYAVDHALFGLDPRGFRVQQQLWYLAAVVLLYGWLRDVLGALRERLPGAVPEARVPLLAFLVALLFALHPAHVESVTWLSGRKDVLSGAFMLGALLCAFRWSGQLRAWGYLAGALLCMVLGLLSKPTAVVLPALFLVQDWVRREPLVQVLRARAPLYLGSGALALAFILFYTGLTSEHAGALAAVQDRLFEGAAPLRWGQQYARYVAIGIAPLGLSPLLPPELLDPRPLSVASLVGVGVLVVLIAATLVGVRRRSPWLLALGLFALPLLPSVLVPAWGQYLAARYMFHAVIGVALALVLAGAMLVAARPQLVRPLVLAALGLAGTWGLLTVQYNATWERGSTLWLGALEHHPRFTALHELGAGAAVAEGDRALAVGILSRCLEVDAEHAPCLAQMGELLLVPSPEQGEAMLRRALPRDTGPAHRVLARHLLRTGRAAEGLALLEAHLEGRPTAAATFALLAHLASAAGQGDKALGYGRHIARAAAANHPASPPPAAPLRAIAQRAGDAELLERIDAAAHCGRSDCFLEALGW